MDTQPKPTPTPGTNAPAPPHTPDAHGEPGDIDPKTLPRITTWAIILLIIAFAAVLGGLFLMGFLPHQANERQLDADAQMAGDNTTPTVDVAKPTRTPTNTNLTLPGDAHALQETSLYSRTNGYLKRLLVDIGDHVKEGQLLAQIDTPEVDAQLQQSRAALELAKANAKKAATDTGLAKDTFTRYEGTAKTGGVTKQQLDEKHSAYDQSVASEQAAKADIDVAQADIDRLTSLQGFEKITAPFTGTITARNFDVGALLSSTNTGPTNNLFSMARTDTLRVFVDVPQTYITLIKPGDPATYSVRNYPGRLFKGSVARTTDELDLTTRTQRYEVHFPNPDGLLEPGMYGQINFDVHQTKPPLMIPTSALLFASEGLTVAVVDDQHHIHMQKITLGRDFGAKVEITDGLTGQEDIVTNPGERLTEGLTIRLASERKTPPNDTQHPDAKEMTDRSKP